MSGHFDINDAYQIVIDWYRTLKSGDVIWVPAWINDSPCIDALDVFRFNPSHIATEKWVVVNQNHTGFTMCPEHFKKPHEYWRTEYGVPLSPLFEKENFNLFPHPLGWPNWRKVLFCGNKFKRAN